MRTLTHFAFLIFLCTCVPALLFGQEEDQLYSITKFEIAKGREADARDHLTKMVKAYYENGLTAETTFNLYDNGSLEVVHPIDDYAGLDRIEHLFDFAYGSMDTTLRTATFDRERWDKNVVSQRAGILRLHKDLSYDPNEDKPEAQPLNRGELITLDIRPGVKAKAVSDHAKALVAMMEEVDSPLEVSFYSYDAGESSRRFEIIVGGENKADLKRRMAEHERLLGSRLKEWRKERDKLVKEVDRQGITYQEEMSQKAEKNTGQAFVAQILTPKEGRASELLGVIAKAADLSREGKDEVYYKTYRMDDGRIYIVAPIKNMSDVDKLYERSASRSYKVDMEKRGQLLEQRGKLTDEMSQIIAGRQQEYTYVPEGVDMSEYNLYRHQEMEFDMEDYAEVLEAVEEIVRLNKEKNALVPFSVYFYEFGGKTNRMFVHDYGTSRATLERDREKDVDILAGPEYDAWLEKVSEITRTVYMTYGELVPEASNMKPEPETAR